MNERFFEKAGGLAIVAILIFACLKIVSPFLGALLWGGIIAVSTWPLYQKLRNRLGNKQRFAATMLTIGLIVIFVMPISLIIYSLTEHVNSLGNLTNDLTAMSFPKAPEWLVNAPVIGPSINDFWLKASADMPALLEQARPIIRDSLTWLFKQSGNLSLSLLEFLLAIVLAGFLSAHGLEAKEFIDRLIHRIAGQQAQTLIDIAGQTVRAVSVGVVGTALIQALLSVIGFVIASVPGAALLAVLCFILAMMQVGTALVWIPVAFWLNYHDQTGLLIFFIIWNVFINLSDNFIKPYLISQGSQLPIPLIFLGVLGGILAWGLVGIFIGPTLLVVSYTLLNSWLALKN